MARSPVARLDLPVARPRVLVRPPAAAAATTLEPAFLTHAREVYAAKVNPTLVAGFLTHTREVYALDLDVTLLPASLTHTRAIYAAQANPTVTPGLTTHARDIYSPTVQAGLTLLPGFTTHTRAIYTPTVSPQLRPGFTTHTRDIYTPAVSPQVRPGFTVHTRDIYAPNVVNVMRPAFLEHTRQMFTPIVSPQVRPGLIVHARAIYLPGVSTFAECLKNALLANSPLGYWRLGEPSGTNADDLGSGDNDGTYTNSPTLGVSSPEIGDGDTAAEFNVSVGNQYVNCGASTDFNLTGTITVAAWIKPSALPATVGRMLSKDGAYGFGLRSTGRLRFTTFGIKDYDSVTMPVLSVGTWYYVAAVLDASFDVTFFVDGTQYDTIAGTTAPNTSVSPLLIGMRNTALAEPFKGVIDEPVLFAADQSGRIADYFNASPNSCEPVLAKRYRHEHAGIQHDR